MTLLEKVKLNLRLTTDVFDSEINDLIAAALLDLGYTADIYNLDTDDSLVARAIITYCKANFGESSEYERYKSIYDEMKAAMSMSSRYTEWGE